ncbi:MAG TPA: efflux RND transporter periplasmic adaptor subunit [Phycisphaerales bacterium]|nr:efflux RND transporter periplasmic adaptor subunit [Phycisphaerales bacterium]
MKEVLVLEGERVEAGQIVVRLIDDDARLGLRAAAATVAERVSDVERAKAALATAESQVLVEVSAVEELRDEVTRSRDLVAVGAVPAGEFRRMEIRLRGLEARVVTAESVVSEARAALVQAEAARDAAQVEEEQASLELSRMEVRSPASGVVLVRLVEPGSRISMSDNGGDSAAGNSMTGTVLRLYDPASLQVRVDVPLADAAKVGVGTRATVSTEALPDQSFSGVVSRVVHEANIQRNTVQFKVALDVPSSVLKAEMLTRVKLHGSSTAVRDRRMGASADGMAVDRDSGDQVLLVPAAALVTTAEGKAHVWIVDSGSGVPVARRREVATAPAPDEGYVVVNSGLRLTDRVILDPPAPPKIRDGTRLKILGDVTTAASSAEPTTP